MDKYQIFISYRRDGGDALAGRLADRFNALGYKVFYDVESMRSGTFNTQILDAIAQCDDVLLVLPPNALDRCVNVDDWVRQELAFALKYNKNIIPIIMRGFEFPKTLPVDIDKIRYMEGVTASSEYFDAVIERIENLLKSRRTSTRVKEGNSKVTEQIIKVPRLLRTPDSKFMAWGQLCLKNLEREHMSYCVRQKGIMSKSLDAYLEECYTVRNKLIKEHPNIHLTSFNKEEHIREYNLFHDFKSEAKKVLQKYLGINDDSLLNLHTESLNMLRTYISSLYVEQPIGYQTRIAELIWLFFDFDYPLRNAYFGLTSSVLEHVFQGVSLLDFKEIYYGDKDLSISKRKNKYEILKEVSCTVQLIATGIKDTHVQNQQLQLFLYAVICFYSLCGCAYKAKHFKKYLLMNHKYLSKKNVVLLEETKELFLKAIEVCDMHIKINRE